MAKIKTINQLITVFKDAANRHYQINGFGIGDNWEIGASKASMHPVLWINPVSAIMAESENNIGYKTFEIDFEIRVFDLVNKDESNENEVLSDTIDILKDIITEFKTHPYYTNSQLNIVNDINFEPFTEEYDEEVSGWVCELSLKSPLISSWCGLPMAEIEGFSFPGYDCDGYNAVCDATYVDDVVGVYPIEVTTASGNTKIVSIDNAFLTGLTLTDGNATTANGNSVDLGGPLTQPYTVISGSSTEVLDIGGNTSNNLAQVRINSTSFQSNHLTAYDGTGIGTYINTNPGGFSSVNTINSTSRTEIANSSSNAGLYNTSNKIVRLFFNGPSGIAPGSGESFTLNGTTFTEGIDFIGQGNAALDAATIAALDYSSVIYFDSVTDEGSGFVRFNFTLPVQVSETFTHGNFLLFNWESSVQTDDTGVTIKVGDDDFYGTPGTILAIGDSETIFTDNSAIPKGIQYGANYDATLVDDSLITKRYVDNAITGITDNNYYTTGATLIGNTVYFNRNDTLSAYTADLSSLSVTLTDGNATTANGTSIDLGGAFTQLTTTLSGSNTETFNIGDNVSGGNIDTTNINSSNLNIRNLTSYDGNGVGTNINLSAAGLFVDNNLDTNSMSFLGSFIGSSTLQYNDNRMLKLFLPNGGIANGSGESFIVNGITYTEGIDFTGQGNKALDVATLLGLDYSTVPNFVKVTYDGSSLFYEFIQNATLTTNITDAIITDKQYNEQVSVNNQGVIIADNGTELVLSNKNDKHYFKDDTLVPKGLQYDSDYSANYAPLSLITYKDLTGYTTDNFYTTGSTIIGNTIYFNRNDTLSAYTVDLSSIIPTDTNFANTNLTFTGNRTHQLNGFDLTIANGALSNDRALIVNSFKDVYTRGKGDQNNLVLGFNTGRAITSAANNVILGDLAGQNMTTAQNTVLIGRSAGAAITTTANQTVAIGRGALENITVSSDNTAIGYFALNAQTGSQFNTALGSSAGSTLTNGGSNVFIGHNAQPLTTTDNNSIVIGRNAVGLGGATVVLGSSIITRTQLRGRVEMDTTTDGFLMPRLTTAQMNAVALPVTNTILYNTDLNGLYRYNGSAWVPLVSFYGGKRYTLIKPNGTQTFYDNLSQVRLNWADGDALHQFADETLSITNTTTISGYLCWSELPAISWNGNGHSVLFNVTNTSAFAVNANKNINLFDLRLTYNCADNSTTNGLIKSPTTSFLNGNGGTTLVQNVTASNANHLNAFGLIGNFDNFNITSLHDKTWQVPGFCNGTFTNCNIRKVYTNRAATFIGCNFNDFVANLFSATNIIFDNCTLVNSVDTLFSSNGGTATITNCTMKFNVNSGTIMNTTVVMNNSTINNVGNGLMFAAYSGSYNICRTTGGGGFLNTASVVTDMGSIFESTGGWNFRFSGSGSIFERTKFINNGPTTSLNTDVAGSGLQASFVDCIFFCNGTNNVGAVSNTYSFIGCTFNRTNFAFMYAGTQQQLLNNIPQRLTQMKDQLGNVGHGIWGNTMKVTTTERTTLAGSWNANQKGTLVFDTTLDQLFVWKGAAFTLII